ncbi:unnamed protein product [Closterium sp. Yama58-4]|nr:unnamed protein product [Closterium sp. Yama58-4]
MPWFQDKRSGTLRSNTPSANTSKANTSGVKLDTAVAHPAHPPSLYPSLFSSVNSIGVEGFDVAVPEGADDEVPLVRVMTRCSGEKLHLAGLAALLEESRSAEHRREDDPPGGGEVEEKEEKRKSRRIGGSRGGGKEAEEERKQRSRRGSRGAGEEAEEEDKRFLQQTWDLLSFLYSDLPRSQMLGSKDDAQGVDRSRQR